MLRHRFRQKIEINTELSLENFIEEQLKDHDKMMINNYESDNNTNQSMTR